MCSRDQSPLRDQARADAGSHREKNQIADLALGPQAKPRFGQCLHVAIAFDKDRTLEGIFQKTPQPDLRPSGQVRRPNGLRTRVEGPRNSHPNRTYLFPRNLRRLHRRVRRVEQHRQILPYALGGSRNPHAREESSMRVDNPGGDFRSTEIQAENKLDCHYRSNPLTRPAPADENAGCGPPSPPRGRGIRVFCFPLSPSGERVDCDGAFISRRGPGEGAGRLHHPRAAHSRSKRTTQIPFAASGASSVSPSPDCLNATFSWPFTLRASRTGHGTRTEIFAAAARSE